MPQNTISPPYDIEPHPALEAQLDAEAQADCDAGRVIPHERVRAWLMKLARGEKVPPPEQSGPTRVFRLRKPLLPGVLSAI